MIGQGNLDFPGCHLGLIDPDLGRDEGQLEPVGPGEGPLRIAKNGLHVLKKLAILYTNTSCERYSHM